MWQQSLYLCEQSSPLVSLALQTFPLVEWTPTHVHVHSASLWSSFEMLQGECGG